MTSVPREQRGAEQRLAWWCGHWGIENRTHCVRDVTLGEDACRIRNSAARQTFAAPRNAIVSLLRLKGQTKIAAAMRKCTWKTQPILAMLGVFKK